MLDFYIMDAAIGQGPFYSINEDTMIITMCIEDEDLIDNGGIWDRLFYARKIMSFPLGDNLFNYLAISYEDLEAVRLAAEASGSWNERHEENEMSSFLASLDCVYLYQLFYSFGRGRLSLKYRSRLDRLSKEFEFALNFCCNDDFEPMLKSLTSLQRYHLYSQLYVDNIVTIDRYYEQNEFLFMETESRITAMDKTPRMSKKTDKHGITIDEFEPVIQKPTLSEKLINSLQASKVSLVFRFQYANIEKYLMRELFTLVKLNVRIKKCASCGKYFILKGDYATDYCDRVPAGEKYTCKRIAAINARKDKLKNNPILREYERAYKRNYARVSNHLMTNEDFRLWVDGATQRRDQAAEQYKASPSNQIISEFKEYLGNK